MTTIYRVGTWQELFALPNFEKDPVHKDLISKGELVSEYEMAPRDGLRPCGILKCETDHRHGYIVRLPDQRLSHVGRNCGKTHFGESWSRVRKALTAAQKLAAKTKAIDELKATIRTELNRWPVFDAPAFLAARLALAHFDRLPEKLRHSLESRAQSGDVAVHGWRTPTDEDKRMAKLHDQKLPASIRFDRGPLQGLRGINRKTRIDYLIDQHGPSLIQEAQSLVDAPDIRSDDLNTMLRRLTAFPDGASTSLKHLHNFLTDANLKVVTYLLAAQDLGIIGLRYEVGDPNGFVVSTKGR
ncbi:MAG: hypothetical protein EPN69_08455 [Rhodanobacter sp.]|nr:MAG: hypothetical protein EPN69_08455 [Rhodanobacter sp.]TAM40137.1 MAG: hypothetical protein EPN58_11680 [Rhodanobacter sp.]